MRQLTRAIAIGLVPLLLAAAAPAWNSALWLADLAQVRTAIDNQYPNREWLTTEREVSLDRWFDRATDAIRASHNDAEARRALEKLIERFNDGHLVLQWPTLSAAGSTPQTVTPSAVPVPTVATFCAARGFDAGQVTAGTAAAMPGYRAIDGGGPFNAGLVPSNDNIVGVVRIGVFSPQGYPTLCEQAMANLGIALNSPCDEACDNRLLTEAYAIMTRGLMSTAERLRAAGAQILLVDLTRNGGGTEWAEAAARIVSPVSLRSAPIAVIRGERWVRRWRDLATKLRTQARRESRAECATLLDYAAKADIIADGLKPCTEPGCSHLARAGYASGLLAELPSGQLDGKPWAADVFAAAQIPYRDSVWKGPLIVLVDSETWSAAEQFTALLADNEAAVVIGTRTGGAGCGHLDGNDPVTLKNSGAKLELPNCARFRKNGSNEVGGIVPNVSTGVRWNDGPTFAGNLTVARLPEAVEQAEALSARKNQ